MGFRLNRSYTLLFEGSVLEGLEINIRATSVATVMEIREHFDDPKLLADLLAQHVTHWNWEDEDGLAVPVAAESFLALEEPVMAAIIKEWYRAATGVTAPLDVESSDGSTLAEIPSQSQ